MVRTLIIYYPKSEFDLILAFAVNSMKDTVGLEDLVPSALLFVEYPILTVAEEFERTLTSAERGTISIQIPSEIKPHLGKMRISRTFCRKLAKATDAVYEKGYLVLFWCEKGPSAKNDEYMGPYKFLFLNHTSKLVHVYFQPNADLLPFYITSLM